PAGCLVVVGWLTVRPRRPRAALCGPGRVPGVRRAAGGGVRRSSGRTAVLWVAPGPDAPPQGLDGPRGGRRRPEEDDRADSGREDDPHEERHAEGDRGVYGLTDHGWLPSCRAPAAGSSSTRSCSPDRHRTQNLVFGPECFT